MPVTLGRAQFDALVEQAVDELPEWVGQHMQNVYITTAMWPGPDQAKASRLDGHTLLLGLYEGVPLTRRGSGYNMHTPDRITLFQRPLELVAESESDLVTLVQRTIIHEIAHHFGFSEDELDRLEPRG
jgi:predicted Zn-dependent protease with MMP-like domain